ncbi:esterase/lipase family protein [Azohydromonas caseinilytica]|uniref:PGAP1-like protein n=1 Tax=Azohydromonas caseinilytica TaxID=2728836 RepID=A0A848F9B2_9BURK|nr:hypothetical protein [Azohydromonas caseinilytica]NML14923.1 hypothetical protein [Azohydromonas caseinilytica]
MATGLHLPVDSRTRGNPQPAGFGTPQQDRAQQVAHFAPRRVLPIVFLPGIMGSNLRITSAERMRQLGRTNPEDNIAWRPDSLGAGNVYGESKLSARERQLQLDPDTTAVDVYNPQSPNPDLDGDERHANVELAEGFRSPYLADDPPTQPGGRTAVQKARQRGWGEVYFKSYGVLLQYLEGRLNNVFTDGRLRPVWRDVVGVDPVRWMADESLPQKALTEDELRQVVNGCWFPVHAIGYNWLQSNDISAKAVAERIEAIIKSYAEARDDNNRPRYECKQVIVVTHSMGGLVGRALVHPDIGGLQDKVLGIVHGVQPAIGAPAAYKRMRAGFEDPGVMHGPETSIGAKVAGNYGDEVTAVLANSPGALQLLPSKAYGEGWLQIRHRNRTLLSLPKKDLKTGEADPYEQIYKLRGKWYALIPNERWLNPAGLTARQGGGTYDRTAKYLNKARQLHTTIEGTYHRCTYVHYGDDRERLSFGSVTWEISAFCPDPSGWESWPILADTRQGQIDLVRYDTSRTYKEQEKLFGPRVGATVPAPIKAILLPPDEPGDLTVPARSAEHQKSRGKCKAVFRQSGYEHQGSYQDTRAVASTLYSIVRIAQQAKWEKRT